MLSGKWLRPYSVASWFECHTLLCLIEADATKNSVAAMACLKYQHCKRWTCLLQELELPEDMNLDDDGRGEQEEEGQQDDSQAGQPQEQSDAFTEKPDAIDENVDDPQAADPDDDMAGDGGDEAAGEAAAADESEAGAEAEEPGQEMEADAFEEEEGEGGGDDPMEGAMGGHEADETEEQTHAQQPEAGPEGLAAATAAPATAQVSLQLLMSCV